jgi:predicted amidohydrolase
MSRLRLGLLQYEVTAPASLDLFAAKLDGLLAEGVAGGASLLVLPEYACMEVAAGFAGVGDPPAELRAVCDVREQLLQIFVQAAQRHGVWLSPGSMPWPDRNRICNRAPLIAPDGKLAFQEKSIMTRFETESWGVTPGAPPGVFETQWGLIGIAICYDVEFPPLVRAQTLAGARLILVPSCTDTQHGFNRVCVSARARAIENQCFVAVAPTVGDAPLLATLDANRGYAAVFGPVDRGFPEDGVIACGEADRGMWVFADLDFAALDTVRKDGAVRNFRDWPEWLAESPIMRLRAMEEK